ncbi:MAG: 3-deoxy-8-phosphooctulonate synthase [Verrucomicrobiota bacterium]
MIPKPFELTENIMIGPARPLVIFAGPCVIESAQMCSDIAGELQEICGRLELSYVFKASFDKANRTSLDSFRGPGLENGLEILAGIRAQLNLPVITDIHDCAQAAPVAAAVDILQIPAFLSRQTDLLVAAAETGRPVNVKKGQFLAPQDMGPVLHKLRDSGNDRVLLTERGTSFGYNNLVVDMRSLVLMRQLGAPVVFDATHSVQTPGGQGGTSGGRREFVRPLARAAAAVGIDGLFIECHPNPDNARSDGPNSVPLHEMENLLREIRDIHDLH